MVKGSVIGNIVAASDTDGNYRDEYKLILFLRLFLLIPAIFIGCSKPCCPFPATEIQVMRPRQAQGTVIVVPGLNTDPEAMNPLIRFLNAESFTTVRVTLAGNGSANAKHSASFEGWINDVNEAFIVASQSSAPVYAIGFSAGAAAILSYLKHKPDSQIEKLVLIAPAIVPHGYTYIPSLLTGLRHFELSLPSAAPPTYRRFSSTSLSSYSALYKAMEDIYEFRISLPSTLFLLKIDDEFIDRDKLDRWIERNEQSQCKVVTISSSVDSGLPHHLMIDEHSLGVQGWQQLTEELRHFLLPK